MGLLTLAMTPAKAASLLTRAVIRRQCPAFGGGPEFQVAGLPQGRAWAAIPCRKSETKVSLLHEHCILFACRIVGPPFRRRVRDDKSERKNRRAKISCNPLISLVSDERIQGNPRKSKEIKPPKAGVFVSKRVRSKKTQTGSTNGVAATVEKEPNRLVTAVTSVFVIPVAPYLGALDLGKEDMIQALGLSFWRRAR
jgi:hypothetical protein